MRISQPPELSHHTAAVSPAHFTLISALHVYLHVHVHSLSFKPLFFRKRVWKGLCKFFREHLHTCHAYRRRRNFRGSLIFVGEHYPRKLDPRKIVPINN